MADTGTIFNGMFAAFGNSIAVSFMSLFAYATADPELELPEIIRCITLKTAANANRAGLKLEKQNT